MNNNLSHSLPDNQDNATKIQTWLVAEISSLLGVIHYILKLVLIQMVTILQFI